MRTKFADVHLKLARRRGHKLLVFTLVALLLCWRSPFSVRAVAGDLDPTFGTGGRVTTDFGNSFDEQASALAIQPDGKLVAGGFSASDFALARYNSDGSLDASFGSGGKVTTDFFGGVDSGRALVIQPDGRVILAGSATSVTTGRDFALARYNSNASIDTSFGVGGKVTTDFGTVGTETTPEGIEKLVIQPDGKLVAVGFASRPIVEETVLLAIARYNSDGTLDTSFGSGGKVTFFAGAFSNIAFNDVKILPDGKILAAGGANPSSSRFGDSDFALFRCNTDGSLDTSFGLGGKVTTDFFEDVDKASSVVVQADGKVVLAGFARTVSTSLDFALARYNADGSLDTSFGLGGKVTTDFFGGFDGISSLIILPDGKLMAFGSTSTDFAFARYNTDGSLDTSFGSAGKLTTDFFGEVDSGRALVIQPDGRLVAAGMATNSITGQDFALARYHGVGGTIFDMCLQDDTNDDILRFNSMTGEYSLIRCSKGITLTGTGVLGGSFCKLTLQDGGPDLKRRDRNVSVLFNTCTHTADASVSIFASGQSFTIHDSDTRNSTCACRY
jgi:uncharacterized delta-60 repeat protein